jgi:hypothetical protein
MTSFTKWEGVYDIEYNALLYQKLIFVHMVYHDYVWATNSWVPTNDSFDEPHVLMLHEAFF